MLSPSRAAFRSRPRFRPMLELLEDRVVPTSFTVVLGTDTGGAAGTMVTVTTGDLRYCLNQSNLTPGGNSISFNIPGAVPQTISLTAALPTITQAVSILGQSQPGFTSPSNVNTDPFFNSPFPPIIIDGSSAGGGTNGLSFTGTASGSVVECLILQHFSGNGMLFTGSANNLVNNCVVSANGGNGIDVTGAAATSNRIENSFIGVDKSGNVSEGNALDGVLIDQGASGNVIGGGNFFAAQHHRRQRRQWRPHRQWCLEQPGAGGRYRRQHRQQHAPA